MLTRLRFTLLALLCSGFLVGCSQTESQKEDPIPIRIVIVSMFEIGEVEGDQPGEFQLWRERRDLDTLLPFENSPHEIYLNEETGVLGVITGIGTPYSTLTTMALAMDPRFDLSQAYWLVAGIAGIDPNDASLGSAAWAEYLVDGDLAHAIDVREMPEDWEIGIFPRHTQEPYDPNKPEPSFEMLQLNSELVNWAYHLTKDMQLPDMDGLQESRERYTEHPNAQKPPFVLKGDQLAASRFWHGSILNDWANKWVDYWTEGEGEFVTSAMEDTGTYLALSYAHNTGRVDKNRMMVLRTGSNYSMQPPDLSAAESLLSENEGYAGLDAALESAYIVGSAAIDEILDNWDLYRKRTPTPADLQ